MIQKSLLTLVLLVINMLAFSQSQHVTSAAIILKQYESNKSGTGTEKKKTDLRKYFAPFLPKGETSETIQPTILHSLGNKDSK